MSNETKEFPRKYVAAAANFGEWAAAEPYYKELVERPIGTVAELERWLIDASEFHACFDEEGTRRYVAMTCQTDDPERQQRYMHFLEHVQPHAEPWNHKLRQKFVELAGKLDLPKRRYEVLERSLRNAIELYRDENIPLLVEDQKLKAEYQQITGAMTVEYQGQELTLQQLARFLEEPDRNVREETWRLGADRFLQDADKLDELYVKMVGIRHQVAQNANCRDFREYMFRAMERFDYTPQDCLDFHNSIAQVCVPAAKELADERQRKLGVASLRPWDMACDPDGLPPLRPFEKDEELVDGCRRIFAKVNPELGKIFETLRDRQSLDLGSRKGKAPGGYQTTYAELRQPFIFMNAVGTEGDVRTLLHEGGHAFHTWACRNEPFIAYRSAPIEFAEVASMGMECLALRFTDEFFADQTPRATRHFFEKIVTFFPYMACIDAFQHFVYTHVDAGIGAWKDHWQELTKQFSPELDLSGLERHNRQSWQKKLHIYEVPFYYVEYGIAQLGALQVWTNALGDYEQAVAEYRRGLSLGGARPLPELFEAAGCKFDFNEATLRPLIEAAMQRIRSA